MENNKFYVMKNITISTILFLFITALIDVGCSKKWLDTDPLSFYEPTTTFTTQEGLEAALTTCNRHLRHYFYADAAPFYTDFLFSDMGVEGTTDKSGPAQDINALVTPSSNNESENTNRINFFWTEGFYGIKYANSIISNVDKVEGLDTDVRNKILARAYFHRAWEYYTLIFSFGNVPLITQEVSSPKLDYKSTKMEVIIEKMIQDLEFAVKYAPDFVAYGAECKGSCRQLLAKYYLAACEFDKALAQTDTLINNSGYSLMTSNFGTFVNPSPEVHPITENVIWDLHRPENKSIATNTEVIHVMVSRYDYSESRQSTYTMRNAVPFWPNTGTNGVRTPNTKIAAMVCNASSDLIDLRSTYGRGIHRSRETWYATNTIWSDPNDLRHSREKGNWMTMKDLVYNNPKMLGTADAEYFGKNIMQYKPDGTSLVIDTIRSWGEWPHYKLWVEDPANASVNNYNGGPGDWYLYRLAETYLIRAEANFWKGNTAKAAQDVNIIRKRAGCTSEYSTADMGVIMDERARELAYEEYRHMELVRVSYIFAKTNGTDEFGNSYTYSSLASLSQNSYWKTRVDKYNNFYNKGVKTIYGVYYTISNFHVLWPVPQDEIDANLYGIINQNYGYTGYENNVDPYDNLTDALAAENN
jgi:starch-binding outer membrane protein, SusD/RagB family